MEPIIYRRSTWMIVRYLLLCCIMFIIIAVIFYAVFSGQVSRKYAKTFLTVAVVGLAFFGLCVFLFLRMVMKRSIILQIDEEGIFDATSYISIGRIAWKDMRTISQRSMAGQNFITISLADDEKYLQNVSFFKRYLIQMNYNLGYPTVVLNFTMIKVKPEILLEELRQRKKYYSQK